MTDIVLTSHTLCTIIYSRQPRNWGFIFFYRNGYNKMNSNPNGNRQYTQTPPSPQNARSAAPRPVDNSGLRQRTRQYADIQNAERNRIMQENPDIIKHRDYRNSYASKRKRNALLILILVIFLAFSLSLLLVWGLATLIKGFTLPDKETETVFYSVEDHTPDPSPTPDTEVSGGEDDPDDYSKTVYAQRNENTVSIGSELLSSKAILIELNSNDDDIVIAEKGGDDRIYPASMTKIMTLLVAVENMQSLDQLATVTQATVDYCYIEGASIAYYKANEVLTVQDLLYGTILPSGADATMTLAECIAGSEEAFVELMNNKVAELELTGTHFVNTSGLHHEDHYSTPHDIALILKAAMENNICYKVLSAAAYSRGPSNKNPAPQPLSSIVHNRLADTEIDGLEIVGGKTGYTPEAGQCLATYAVSNDGKHEYILVTAHADPSKKMDPVKDADYIYKTYANESNQSTDVAA